MTEALREVAYSHPSVLDRIPTTEAEADSDAGNRLRVRTELTAVLARMIFEDDQAEKLRWQNRVEVMDGTWQARYDQRLQHYAGDVRYILEHTFHPCQAMSERVMEKFLDIKHELLQELAARRQRRRHK